MIIEADIDEIFEKIEKEDFMSFLDAIRTNQIEAEKHLKRSISSFIFVWAVFYLISAGLVSEGSIGAFKVTNVRLLLLSAPPIIGVLFYLISLYRATSSTLFRSLNAGYNKLYPKTLGLNMANYLSQPSFLSIENFFEDKAYYTWMNTFSSLWRFVGGGIIFFSPLIAFVHIAFIMWFPQVAHPALLILSILIGLIMIIRGILIWFIESPILELTQTD